MANLSLPVVICVACRQELLRSFDTEILICPSCGFAVTLLALEQMARVGLVRLGECPDPKDPSRTKRGYLVEPTPGTYREIAVPSKYPWQPNATVSSKFSLTEEQYSQLMDQQLEKAMYTP